MQNSCIYVGQAIVYSVHEVVISKSSVGFCLNCGWHIGCHTPTTLSSLIMTHWFTHCGLHNNTYKLLGHVDASAKIPAVCKQYEKHCVMARLVRVVTTVLEELKFTCFVSEACKDGDTREDQ